MPNRKRHLNSVRVVILALTEMAPELPSLPDTCDADMALMYLRHLEKHLAWEVRTSYPTEIVIDEAGRPVPPTITLSDYQGENR